MSQITDLKAKKVAPGDKPVADGTISGLRLEPGSAKGQGKWILRFVSPVTGKRRDMGLGTYPEVGIADARRRGMEARQMIGGGKDPIEEREADRAARAALAGAMTFEQAARQVHQGMKPGWKNPKHADQWINTLRDYAFPTIGKKKVADLAPTDFAEVLRPIWLAKPETASRVKQRCDTVMKWCWARELIKGNPVDVVDHLLPQQPGKRERTTHQPSMPWRDIPAFVQGVLHAGASNVTRALLEFVILTAARSGEARAMTWAEVDLKAKVWTVPADRMKARVVHRVPLSKLAVEILAAQRDLHPDADLVFPAPRGGVLSDMVLTKFLRDQKAQSSDKGRVATAHGFRSSFRDWASEKGYPRDLAERALAHTVKNQAEAAYHRTDLLEQRRAMMEAWARHVGGFAAAGSVVPLRGRKE
ncbi:Integrase [Rhizobiales bacterium GAS191]|nr:Integrase [Rhizobiales bacterium GAS191]